MRNPYRNIPMINRAMHIVRLVSNVGISANDTAVPKLQMDWNSIRTAIFDKLVRLIIKLDNGALIKQDTPNANVAAELIVPIEAIGSLKMSTRYVGSLLRSIKKANPVVILQIVLANTAPEVQI